MNLELEELKKLNKLLKKELFDISIKYNNELEEYKTINELKLLLLTTAYEKKKKKKFLCF